MSDAIAIAFSGWATTLLLGLIVGEVVRRAIRRRELAMARSIATIDVRSMADYLGYAYWQMRNPAAHPRYPNYPNEGLFELWFPVIARRFPELTGPATFLYSWTRHVQGQTSRGEPPDIWGESLADVAGQATILSDKLDLRLGNVFALINRDYSLP